MVITPSLPTLSIALAIMSPIALSPLAETVPTWAISAHWSTLLRPVLEVVHHQVAGEVDALRSIGFMPAATDLAPSRTIAWASTVAVVVPSPAVSDVRRHLAHHLGAHVLELVRELDLLGDGDAVLGDARRAVGLVEHDVMALRAERGP